MPRFSEMNDDERFLVESAIDNRLTGIAETQTKLRSRRDAPGVGDQEKNAIKTALERLELQADALQDYKEALQTCADVLTAPTEADIRALQEWVAAIRAVNVRNQQASAILAIAVTVVKNLPGEPGGGGPKI